MTSPCASWPRALAKSVPFLLASLVMGPLVLAPRNAEVRMTVYASRVTFGTLETAGRPLMPSQTVTQLTLYGPAAYEPVGGSLLALQSPTASRTTSPAKIELRDATARLTLTGSSQAPLRLEPLMTRGESKVDVQSEGGPFASTRIFLTSAQPVVALVRASFTGKPSLRCESCRAEAKEEAERASWTGLILPPEGAEEHGGYSARISAPGDELALAVRGGSTVITDQPTALTGPIAFERATADGSRRVSAITRPSLIVIEDTGKKIELEPHDYIVVEPPHKLTLLALAQDEAGGLRLDLYGTVRHLRTGRSAHALKDQLPSWLAYWYQRKDEDWLLWLSVSLVVGGMLLKIALEVGWIQSKEKP